MLTEYVLDASAAIKLFRPEPESAAFGAWFTAQLEAGHVFIAPGIFPFEVRHAAAKALRQGEMATASDALRAAESAVLSVQVQPVPAALEMQYAHKLRLSTYDAAYAALAAAGRPLVTYDARLAEAVETAIMPGRA